MLVRSQENPTLFKISLNLPAGVVVHYKYFILCEDGQAVWEDLISDRELAVGHREMSVDDGVFDQKNSSCFKIKFHKLIC
jgi:hypothetical protein